MARKNLKFIKGKNIIYIVIILVLVFLIFYRYIVYKRIDKNEIFSTLSYRHLNNYNDNSTLDSIIFEEMIDPDFLVARMNENIDERQMRYKTLDDIYSIIENTTSSAKSIEKLELTKDSINNFIDKQNININFYESIDDVTNISIKNIPEEGNNIFNNLIIKDSQRFLINSSVYNQIIPYLDNLKKVETKLAFLIRCINMLCHYKFIQTDNNPIIFEYYKILHSFDESEIELKFKSCIDFIKIIHDLKEEYGLAFSTFSEIGIELGESKYLNKQTFSQKISLLYLLYCQYLSKMDFELELQRYLFARAAFTEWKIVKSDDVYKNLIFACLTDVYIEDLIDVTYISGGSIAKKDLTKLAMFRSIYMQDNNIKMGPPEYFVNYGILIFQSKRYSFKTNKYDPYNIRRIVKDFKSKLDIRPEIIRLELAYLDHGIYDSFPINRKYLCQYIDSIYRFKFTYGNDLPSHSLNYSPAFEWNRILAKYKVSSEFEPTNIFCEEVESKILLRPIPPKFYNRIKRTLIQLLHNASGDIVKRIEKILLGLKLEKGSDKYIIGLLHAAKSQNGSVFNSNFQKKINKSNYYVETYLIIIILILIILFTLILSYRKNRIRLIEENNAKQKALLLSETMNQLSHIAKDMPRAVRNSSAVKVNESMLNLSAFFEEFYNYTRNNRMNAEMELKLLQDIINITYGHINLMKHINMDDKTNKLDIALPPLILFNIVYNSIKHGRILEVNRKLEITVHDLKNKLEFVFIDNGITKNREMVKINSKSSGLLWIEKVLLIKNRYVYNWYSGKRRDEISGFEVSFSI